jgi:hypothetical protein
VRKNKQDSTTTPFKSLPDASARRSWEEFRETGLLYFINSFLHIFGWEITAYIDGEGKTVECCPTQTDFREINIDSAKLSYKKLARYMKDHSHKLWATAYSPKTEDILSQGEGGAPGVSVEES